MSAPSLVPKIGEPVLTKIRPRYYDHTALIKNAVPNSILTEDPLYNKEEINRFIGRNADKLWVVNDGIEDLFVRYSSGEGIESFSDENVIYPGDYKVYYNVFELHLRSPLANLPYRVSENEISRGRRPVSSSGFGDNQSQFVLMNANSTAFNFFVPRSGYNFFITSILFNVGEGATTMNIYETSDPTSIAMDKELMRIVTSSAGFQAINFSTGGFLKVSEGTYLNAQTTSQPNNITIIGCYRVL